MGRRRKLQLMPVNPEDLLTDLDSLGAEVEQANIVVVARMMERTKRVRFAIYRSIGMRPGDAAARAGYSAEDASNLSFVTSLEKTCRDEGIFSDVEIPFSQLLMAELIPSLAIMRATRDGLIKSKLMYQAARDFVALNGFSVSKNTPTDPADVAERELKTLSPVEQTRAIESGTFPPLSEAPPPEQAAPPASDAEIDQMLLEVEKETGGLLA